MTEKTWIHWLGVLIMAFSIVGLISGFSVLAFPWAPTKARFAGIVTRIAITRLLGSLVFLAVGVYMMMSGSVKK